jgi:DNA-binding PadR family transcriptional regulator
VLAAAAAAWQSPAVDRRPTLSLNEWAVLGLLAERPRHGYDIAAALRPDAEIGQVWRVSRQLVYRALDRLAALDLVEPRRQEPGDAGPRRTVYAANRRGRAAVRRWLRQPVDHLRDVRGALLLKLVLARRLDVDTEELVAAQRSRFSDQLEALASRPPADDPVGRWRHHSAAAVAAFLDDLG